MSRWLRLVAVMMALWTSHALGHSLSASYLTVKTDVERSGLTGRWEIALADLQTLLDLDVDGNAAVTWGEVKARTARIVAVTMPGLDLRQGGSACSASADGLQLNQRTDGYYVVLEFVAPCSAWGGELQVAERLFFERDRTHRTVLAVHRGTSHSAVVLTPDSPVWHAAARDGGALSALRKFFAEGVWHIWIGYDHLAFLLLLLLPVVLRGEGGAWASAGSARPVLWSALRIVTAFTVAHSLTLSLAALGIVTPPDRPVEMAIAGSVAVAGALNLFPAAANFAAAIAFGFGLIHGFGFAGALGELGLERSAVTAPLAGFNLGVETGQLAIVAAVLPLLFVARSSSFYRSRLVPVVSIAVGLLAVGWLIERAG
jgi:HupE/UreJ protein